MPDVRDGLTREERVVLYVLKQAQEEMPIGGSLGGDFGAEGAEEASKK